MKIESIDNVLSKEVPKFHMTYRGNIASISEKGLLPKNGIRNGEIVSKEDPDDRVFFSNGKAATLELANNLAKVLDNTISKKGISPNGYDGKDISSKISEFFEHAAQDTSDKTYGFIDICTYLEQLFENGINQNVSQDDKNQILFNAYKSILDKFVYLDLNIKGSHYIDDEDTDFYYYDTNWNSEGTKKLPMTARNAHLKIGRKVETEKINLVCTPDGNYLSAWEVIKELSRDYIMNHPETTHLPVDEDYYIDPAGNREHYMEHDYLSDFIEMEKENKIKILESNKDDDFER